MRKIIAFLLIFSLCLAFSACGESVTETAESPAESETQVEMITGLQETTAYYIEETTEAVVTAAPETTTAEVTTAEPSTAPAETEPETAAPPQKEDVTSWDTARIVEFYKNAAASTGESVQSSQTVGLSDISVNNGQLGGVFSFVTPILSSFLSSSATVTDGITGDFGKLIASDVVSAEAYELASGTAVEIILNEQTDTGASDSRDGSVAHGIYIVGDLLSVISQLKDKGLPIEIDSDKTVIKYTEPVIKAIISEEGKIISGTWSCTVEIGLSDYKFAGSPVDSTVVVLDNKITVNGGFPA